MSNRELNRELRGLAGALREIGKCGDAPDHPLSLVKPKAWWMRKAKVVSATIRRLDGLGGVEGAAMMLVQMCEDRPGSAEVDYALEDLARELRRS